MSPKKIRMVRCTYVGPGESPWVPMGRARTRCPRCGAVVQSEKPTRFHYVTRRVPEGDET